MEKLDYFTGKVCTILTLPVNIDFKHKGADNYLKDIYSYFLGRIESVNQLGVVIEHLGKNTKSFFPWNAIVCIAEEEELDPEKDSEIIEKIKETPARVEIRPPQTYVDIDALNKLIQKPSASKGS